MEMKFKAPVLKKDKKLCQTYRRQIVSVKMYSALNVY